MGSDDAEAFEAAIDKGSRIVSGHAIGRGGEGALYTLTNGQTYRLNRADTEAMSNQKKLKWSGVHD
jgi:hemin uptake protein HemP